VFPAGNRATPEIFIMVIGESGTGKSTFINTTVNFFRGGSLGKGGSKLKIAIPTTFLTATEPEGRYATERDTKQGDISQTNECTHYRFEYKGRPVTVIDSPGLNDTRGLEQDEKNLKHIMQTIEQLPHLNALIVTTNGTQQRLEWQPGTC
jgi:septin family protein